VEVQASGAVSLKGNKVIISGRRKSALEEWEERIRGLISLNSTSKIPRALHPSPIRLVKQHPELNVLINNAGIMKVDNLQNAVDDALVSSIVRTNLLGPIRMTSALIAQSPRGMEDRLCHP
jgi:uncharacterized oxidoreductase